MHGFAPAAAGGFLNNSILVVRVDFVFYFLYVNPYSFFVLSLIARLIVSYAE